MSKILCISRQYGSGGHEIGNMLADMLALPCYDKLILDEAAKRSGLAEDVLKQADERIANPYLYALNFDSPVPEYRGKTVNDILYLAERKVITEYADKGNSIFVGRAAGEYLRQNTNHTVLHVFIAADAADRLNCLMQREGLTEKKAMDRLRKIDKYRTDYNQLYTGSNWGAPADYDACFSTSRQSAGWIANVISELFSAEK